MKLPVWLWRYDKAAKHYKVTEVLSKETMDGEIYYKQGLSFGIYPNFGITRLIRLNLNVNMHFGKSIIKNMKKLDSFPEKQSLIRGIFAGGVL